MPVERRAGSVSLLQCGPPVAFDSGELYAPSAYWLHAGNVGRSHCSLPVAESTSWFLYCDQHSKFFPDCPPVVPNQLGACPSCLRRS